MKINRQVSIQYKYRTQFSGSAVKKLKIFRGRGKLTTALTRQFWHIISKPNPSSIQWWFIIDNGGNAYTLTKKRNLNIKRKIHFLSVFRERLCTRKQSNFLQFFVKDCARGSKLITNYIICYRHPNGTKVTHIPK